MTERLKQKLLDTARKEIKSDDPSHDMLHSLSVLALAEKIAKTEGADLDIIVPAALFHDVIVYPKSHPKSKQEADESAAYTGKLLRAIVEYPKAKIEKVMEAIREHSFANGITPTSLEGKILKDADKLEATGAIAIMRTFTSGGLERRKLYHDTDPFCETRIPEAFTYSLDVFYERLLKVESSMHTSLAKKLARKRTVFLHTFLEELRQELRDI